MAQLVKNPLQCRRLRFNSWVGKIRWRRDRLPTPVFLVFPCDSAGKESSPNAGDLGSIPGLRRSPGEGKGYPLQYSGLKNFMDCIVHGVAKNQTQLSNFCFIPLFRLHIWVISETFLCVIRCQTPPGKVSEVLLSSFCGKELGNLQGLSHFFVIIQQISCRMLEFRSFTSFLYPILPCLCSTYSQLFFWSCHSFSLWGGIWCQKIASLP